MPGSARPWTPPRGDGDGLADAATEPTDLDLAERAAVELMACGAREDTCHVLRRADVERRNSDAPLLVGLGLAVGTAIGATLGLGLGSGDWRGAGVAGGVGAITIGALVIWYLVSRPDVEAPALRAPALP